jgi:hypothetical protein
MQYVGKYIKIVEFSIETLKARRTWSNVFQVWNKNNFNPKVLYPENYQSKLKKK